MPTDTGPVHEFGEFRLDAAGRRLWRGSRQVPLGQKATDALVRLLERPGELVEKDELIALLWPNTVVEENNLNQQISALRKALGETAEQPRHIITVPGRGYRLLTDRVGVAPVVTPSGAHVESLAAASPYNSSSRRTHMLVIAGLVLAVTSIAALLALDRRRESAPDGGAIRSLAVLPLRSLNSAVADEHFGLGIADAIIGSLAAFDGVLIRPTGAVRRYADTTVDPSAAGRALMVDAVLDGTVQRDGNRLRVSVQLVRVSSGASVWTEQFDTEWRDIFSVQDEIARQVARALALELKAGEVTTARLRGRPTTDPDAYAAYLKSRYFWNQRTPDGYLKGIGHAEAAVARDPAFARAYAAIADCYALLGSAPAAGIQRSEAMDRARRAAERALVLDPSLAEAMTSLAFVKMHYDWNWPDAERLFRRAIELDPGYATAHHWYAYYLTAHRRHPEALTRIRRARGLDPLSVIIATDVGELMLYAGQVDEAEAAARAALELDPTFVLARRVLAWADMRRGRHESALETLRAAPGAPGTDATDLRGTLGHLYGLLGRRRSAEDVIRTLKAQSRPGSETAIELSVVYAGLGLGDDAFYWLERSFNDRSGSLILLMVEPLWAPLRQDPRFMDLARRVGLVAAD